MTNKIGAGGVLLDIDGTLLDSNDAHANAWVTILREEGHDVAFEEVRTRIGKGGEKMLWELARVSADSPRGESISARRRALFKERYLPHLRPFPKAREFVERLNAASIVVVVAT